MREWWGEILVAFNWPGLGMKAEKSSKEGLTRCLKFTGLKDACDWYLLEQRSADGA